MARIPRIGEPVAIGLVDGAEDEAFRGARPAEGRDTPDVEHQLDDRLSDPVTGDAAGWVAEMDLVEARRRVDMRAWITGLFSDTQIAKAASARWIAGSAPEARPWPINPPPPP